MSDWKSIYPDQYASYLSGSDSTKEKDGKTHSHADLRKTTEAFEGLWTGVNGGMGCIACKSPDLNALYETYGEDLWAMPYEQLQDEVADYWGCYSCHANDPEGTLAATQVGYKTLAGDYFNTLAPGDAVCGQCHNVLDGYTRRLVSIVGQGLNTLEPYRYGTDADAIMKAFLEDGEKLQKDADGVEWLFAGHADVEIFQGSTMQSLGVTCVDCHMPTVKNAAGEEYTEHNASGSPLENEAALEYCLTCHENQGIASTDAMVEFVKGKQNELKVATEDTQASLDELHALIVAGTSDAEVDAKAREAYLTANWYVSYANCFTEVPGAKAAHDFDEMSEYIVRAKQIADDGIALYK